MSTTHADSILIRERLLKILQRMHRPLTVPDITRYMMRHGTVHKTSLYRQLDKLVAEGNASKVLLDSSVAHYEIARAHHHHLKCVRCHMIMCLHDIDLKKIVSAAEKNVHHATGAVIKGYNISFEGLCVNCQ